MSAGARRTGAVHGLRHPRTTVRWRLTLLYGGLFLVSGVALLAITYTLVQHATFTRSPAPQRVVDHVYSSSRPPAGATTVRPRGASIPTPFTAVPPGSFLQLLQSKTGQRAILFVGSQQRISDLHTLVLYSSIALAIMALLSAGLGWVVAGRVLAPLRTMTTTTQQISAANLNRRLGMEGPPDELRQLADTIDGLLERLEGAFDAQRRFVANASHELRTPLTAARALLEMTLSDPHATVASFRDTCEQVLEEGEEQEQLIDALLALAQGQRGLDRREVVDLGSTTEQIVRGQEGEATAQGLSLRVTIAPATVSGDPRLIERMVSNLVQNAIVHNVDGGEVTVAVASQGGAATLRVVNTGPVVAPDEVERLLQPFQRLTPGRGGFHEGLGLGLSIVAAVAGAHDARLEVTANQAGGLAAQVDFPPVRGDQPSNEDDGAAPVSEAEALARVRA
jgi:signal transduction histidine kinase